MKTQKFHLILLLLFISFNGYGQTIDPESEWRVNHQYAAPENVFNVFYRDFIDGDTVINSIEYYKIYGSGYSYEGLIPTGNIHYFDHSLHGFLREENDKWYTYYVNEDNLLFDFTLDINDTVHSAYTSFIDEPITISDIDSILVDGVYKKRMRLTYDFMQGDKYIIEGIGATTGLFENIVFIEWWSELVCFAKNGISLWGASTEDCDLAININEIVQKQSPCSVSPNPAIDFTTLTIPDNLGKVSFTLIDMIGWMVYQDFFESPSANKIQLTSYHSGIYLAVIESNSMKQTVKLIIE